MGRTRRPRHAAFFVRAQSDTPCVSEHTPKDNDMTSSDANSKARRALTRRGFLKSTAGTAALLGALKTEFPFGVHVAQAAGPEAKKAVLGYIALMDASPLVIAKEKGLFAKHGLPDDEVTKPASWGATPDNILLSSEKNGNDGPHILTP